MTSEEKTRVTVTIYGTQYKLMGTASTPAAHLQMVAAQVDEQMRKISKGFPHLDLPKIAVLTAVNFADEMSTKDKLIAENERYKLEIDSRKEQIAEGQLQRENLQKELQLLRDEHSELQKEFKMERGKSKMGNEHNQDVSKEYEKLKEEYKKLQSEYNEWIEMIDPNDSDR